MVNISNRSFNVCSLSTPMQLCVRERERWVHEHWINRLYTTMTSFNECLKIHVHVQYMSNKMSPYSNSMITLVLLSVYYSNYCITTVVLSIRTNNCRNYCRTTVVWLWNYWVITVLYGDILLPCTVYVQ